MYIFSNSFCRNPPNPLLIKLSLHENLAQISTPLNGAAVRKITSSHTDRCSVFLLQLNFTDHFPSFSCSSRWPPTPEKDTLLVRGNLSSGAIAASERPGAGVLLFHSLTRHRDSCRSTRFRTLWYTSFLIRALCCVAVFDLKVYVVYTL